MSKWIQLKDQVPGIDQRVLVDCGNGYVEISFIRVYQVHKYDTPTDQWIECYDPQWAVQGVKRWMHLPLTESGFNTGKDTVEVKYEQPKYT